MLLQSFLLLSIPPKMKVGFLNKLVMSYPKPKHFLKGCFYEMTSRQALCYKEKKSCENNFSLRTKNSSTGYNDFFSHKVLPENFLVCVD